MTDVFALRRDLDAARVARDTARATADDKELKVQRLLRWVEMGAPNTPHGRDPLQMRDEALAEAATRRGEVEELTTRTKAIGEQIERALDAEAPLFGRRTDAPIALLPVRLETSFTGARKLRIRIYPDEIHVDAHDEALTEAEVEAGRRYWKQPTPESWQELLESVSPTRAAWVAHATRGDARPQTRPADRRRAPHVSTLPSKWRIVGISGGEVVVDEVGKPIPERVPLGILDPDERGPEPHADWLVDYNAAVRIGMAVTVTLPAGHQGLDQLFVVGVQDSPPREAARKLQATLRAHVFTSGMAFLAPGTPTNNTPETRSDWSSRAKPRRPAARKPALAERSDAHRLATALGLPDAAVLAYSRGAGRDTYTAAQAMSAFSWAALAKHLVSDATLRVDLGEGFENLDPAAFSPVRRQLVGDVRSRGVLPTFRIGAQPYGVLPVSSLDEWEPDEPGPQEQVVLPWIMRLRHHWRAALTSGWIPRVSDGRAADRTAVDALIRLPTARDLVIRRILSHTESIAEFDKQSERAPGPVMSVGHIRYDSALRWARPSEVVSNLAWNSDTTPPNFSLIPQRLVPDPARDLEVLKRSAEKYADALAVLAGRTSPRDYAERWLKKQEGILMPRVRTIFGPSPANLDFVLALVDMSNWESFPGTPDPDNLNRALTLTRDVDAFVSARLTPQEGHPNRAEALRRFAEEGLERSPDVMAWIKALSEVEEDELLPLAFEALDLFSHRWDAWATSFPARRLRLLREEGRTDIRIGGYGWVENLRPAKPPETVPGTQLLRSRGDGYVHAPSLHHAATAAVLRSGFSGHEGESTFAVDLSSRRVRVARWLLAGVRRGQDLASLLGYRFERALHDSQLDDLIGQFRRQFPIATVPAAAGQQLNATWDRSHEAIAVRNVLDGLSLAKAGPVVEQVALGQDETRRDALLRAHGELVDALDAVGDLLLAESVHQVIGGNPLRAGVAADTLGRGEQVPERYDVTTTPRRGRALTHRLVTVVPARSGRVNGWGNDEFTVLDPRLDAWVAHLLGPAEAWSLQGTVVADGVEHPVSTDAGALGFSALGMVLVSDERRGRLDQRLRELAGQTEGRVEPGAGWAELAELCRVIRTLLAASRAAEPDDVAPGSARARVDLDELATRLDGFTTRLGDVDVRRSLGLARPTRLAKLVEAERGRRWMPRVVEALEDLLGTHVPVAPLLRGASLPEALTGIPGSTLTDWLRRYAAVRPSVRAWHDLIGLADGRNGTASELSAAQRPSGGAWVAGVFPVKERPPAREHWVRHLPFGVPTAAYAAFVVDQWADVLPGSDALSATKRGEGAVPVESELTGLSFHFDRPDARAPQAVLLAVPPNRKRGWTADTLALALRDALELAKLRAVDLGDLPMLDDLLPAARVTHFEPVGDLAFTFWNELVEE